MRQGGAERLVSQLLPRFVSAGVDAHLALFDGTDSPFLEAVRNGGVTVHILGNGYREMYNPMQVKRLQKLFQTGDYDIVHTHNSSPQLFAALAGRPASTRLVTTEHNTDNRRRSWGWYRPLDRWMYGRYDHIVCCSKPVELSLADTLGPDFVPRISTITNGIDLTAFAGRSCSDRSYDSDNTTPVRILMVAAFRPQKDHLTPLRALTVLPDNVTLTYAGDGPTRDEAMRYAESLGVADRVKFLGNASDIPSLYREADIALLSTHHEGLSLSTIEAMASGTPLVVSSAPGVADTVGDSSLQFPIGDHKALAEQINALISNPGLYAEMSDKGITRAAQFDISLTARAHLDLYTSIINNKSYHTK